MQNYFTLGNAGGEICVVESPLKVPYLTAYVETNNLCDGCSYANTMPEDSLRGTGPSEVHIIYMEKIITPVFHLTIASPSSAAFMLNNSQIVFVALAPEEAMPVSLIIHTSLSNINFVFLVSLYFNILSMLCVLDDSKFLGKRPY